MAAPPKLPVLRTIAAACKSLRANGVVLALMVICLTPVIWVTESLLTPAGCADLPGIGHLFPDATSSKLAARSGSAACELVIALPRYTVTFLGLVILTVAVQRRYLLDGARQSFWTTWGWDIRKTKIALAAMPFMIVATAFGYLALIAAIHIQLPADPETSSLFRLVMATGSLFTDTRLWQFTVGVKLLYLVVTFACLVAFVVLVARFLLIFPAAAMDNGINPLRSWRWTAGNGWRLAAIVSLAPVPSLALMTAAQELLFLSGIERFAFLAEPVPLVLIETLRRVTQLLAIATVAAALAAAYRRTREELHDQALEHLPAADGDSGLRLGRIA